MAQPTNTYSSYDQVGIREDLTDVIHDVSPSDTPFYSSIAKTKATSRYHEWQTDALRTAAANAHIEGDDDVAVARTATTRLGNYTQIFKDVIAVSGTDEGLKKAGRGDEMDYQVVKAGKELKLDVEKALLDNNARVAGSDTVARELAGAPAWLYTNTDFQSGNGGADPTGDGTDARTDDGTPTAFSSTKLDAVLQSIWENSNGERNLTCMLNAFQMTKALTFTGNNNQRATIQAEAGKVAKVIDVYMTPWGTVDFVMSRHIRARDVLVLDYGMWKCANLRSWQTTQLAKTGDNDKKELLVELTLEACNEKANGGVFDNTTS